MREEGTKYGSARDLPSTAKLLEQLRGMKALTLFVARDQRKNLAKLEQELNALIDHIDAFYALLGPSHWIYHDQMNTEVMAGVVAQLTVADAEKALIAYYQDDEVLAFMVRGLRRFSQMRARMPMVERAREDYKAGRYYSTVMLLIAVMDGFVNDIDTSRRRGLHAREPDEMSAWDSVVGHHLGLANAHKTFTKTFAKTSDQEIYELYRNGIMHGTLTNFDNAIVATKAWNRLFAVTDWAASLERQAVPAEPEPTLREVFGKIRQNEEAKQALQAWEPRSVMESDADFETDPLYLLTRDYLAAWIDKNYGRMASRLASLVRGSTPGQTAGKVRDEYSLVELEAYNITKLDYQAPAICEVEVELTCAGETKPGRMRWIRESDDGNPATPNLEGQWRLISWGPWAMFHSAERTDIE